MSRESKTWEEAVAEDANGWVATAMLQRNGKKGKVTRWTISIGPFETQREANNARNRLKAKWKRDEKALNIEPNVRLVGMTVAPLWKTVS